MEVSSKLGRIANLMKPLPFKERKQVRARSETPRTHAARAAQRTARAFELSARH
jgi:hypothetical protein